MYYMMAFNAANGFSWISFVHVRHIENHEANEMVQIASGVNILDKEYSREIKIEKRTLPTLVERGMPTQMSSAKIVDAVKQAEVAEVDWWYPIVKYLCNPLRHHEKATHF